MFCEHLADASGTALKRLYYAKKPCGRRESNDFPNPCHSVTSPIRGIPTAPDVGSGVSAASMFFEHLADADDAALMRLYYAKKPCGRRESCVAVNSLIIKKLCVLCSSFLWSIKDVI